MTQPVIDIIIPVYNAYDDLQRCLDSVLRTAAPPCRLILIDDCSPDSRIAAYFEILRGKNDPRLLLLKNDVNLGFVGTVNRAMALGRNDVILLNSDTVVTAGWLEKMRRCAASDQHIGTITPFSNNAEICSFPNFCKDNQLPAGLSAEEVNRAMEQAAVPLYPDIPTGVGFCMFIRRALLDKIGLFDAETFGLGYGEENDFCMRAVQAGYRNVLCDDTFILHVGSSSFDSKKGALAQENMQRLVAKHPGYLKEVMSFIAADPLKPIRDVAYSFLNLQGEAGQRPGVLHVLHGRKGGTENHIRHLMAAGKGRLRQYLLATFEDAWVLEDANGGRLVTYHLKHEQDELWGALLESLCAAFNIHVCHVHHLAGCRLGLLEALAALHVPYGFTVHDFYLACPTINLLGPGGDYCGAQNGLDHCGQCLAAQPDFAGINIAAWREAHQKFLERAAFVIAPSEWAGSTLKRYFSLADVAVIPHGSGHEGEAHEDTSCSVLLMPDDDKENIGVLGAIGPVKGARRLEKLVERTRERNLPLRWVVVGYLDRQFHAYQDKDKVLTVHGQYDSRDVGALLDHYRIRLVAFPSAGPETYCYTLTEAWQAGRPALVPPIGALGERVSSTGAGWLMEDWQDEDRILDQVLSILKPEHQADLDLAMRAARAVPLFPLARMAEDTERMYGSLAQSGARQPPMPNMRLYQAVKADSGGESNAIDVVIPVRKGFGFRVRKLRILMQCLLTIVRTPAKAPSILLQLYRIWRSSGMLALKQSLLRLPTMGLSNDALEKYRQEFSLEIKPTILSRIRRVTSPPLISILMPTYNTPDEMLRETIQSVLDQLYPNWELCIVDDGSTQPHVKNVLQEYAVRDSRIKLHFERENRGVSYASNHALRLASGEFVVLLDHDDILEEQAIFHVAECVQADDPDMLYSDEVLVSGDGSEVMNYVFRPVFSPELLRSHPYIVHLVGFKTRLLREIGGFDETLTISHDYDLILRASEKARSIVHIPEILYRWRIHGNSAGHQKMHQVMEVSKGVLTRHLERCHESGQVSDGPRFNFFDIRYPLDPHARVAIIIPTKNHGDLVRQCIESIERTVREVAFDIVLIDHASDDSASLAYFGTLKSKLRVLRFEGTFNFSAINNWAVSRLEREYSHYLFCNNDIEAIEPGWLERMMELAKNQSVGIVGAKLFYPDRKTIQHAGICVGAYGAAENFGKYMHNMPDGVLEPGYLGNLIINHEVSAVTAACLLIKKEVFDEVDGFDEKLAVGFGDVDLCLKVGAEGYRILFCPYAQLVHHESFTRGKSTEDPHPEDSAYFQRKWRSLLEAGDPYYNPNLSVFSTGWDVKLPKTHDLILRRRLYRPDRARGRQKIVHSRSGVQ